MQGSILIFGAKNIELNIIQQKKLMDHFEKKEQVYTKWNESIWLSIEKEISLFHMKVTDCMIGLGSLKKIKVEDFNVEPCLNDDVILGQEFYTEFIRPICVQKKYLPSSIPTEADLKEQSDSDSDSDSSSSSEQKEKKEKTAKTESIKQEKKGKKKGGKNQKNNEQERKMKIVKENFLKDIELVLNSHSSERLQIEFGLKHRKLEVKLMTFFYIAYYFRKNKEKQKIDESEVFELVNILIKIVRIFDGFKGKNFVSSDKKKGEDALIEVSKTLILDLKMCIKGLKEHYKYSNRKIIISYPKLVYYTNYDRFFPTLDIKPYPSQIEFIQSVKKALNDKGSLAHPTLVLYKTMIGSGKTSASLSLSNLIADAKTMNQDNENLQVVYSCLIGSVRIQVGRYAYNKEQKFALAAMEKSIKDPNYFYPRIINSYRCRNENIVDLVVSDIDCTYEMLDRHHLSRYESELFEYERKERKKKVNVGKLDKENVILFIDQPTAFCKSVDSFATRKLFDILANYPPKLIIMASATMPDRTQIPKTIELIGKRNPGLQVFQVQSTEFQIGCQYCSFKGEVIFPHTGLKNKEALKNILDRLRKNPFLLRLYTGPSLFFLLKKCENAKIKNLPNINNLPEIKQADIIKLTFKVLELLCKQDDEVIEEVCKLSVDQMNLEYKEEKESDSDDDFFGDDKKEEAVVEEKDKKDYIDFKSMLRRDAHKFLGGCLIGTSDPLSFAKKLFEKWVRKIKPVKRLIEKYRRDVENLDKEIKLLEDDQEMREEKKSQLISKMQSERQANIEFPEHKKINTIDHYKKYCRNKENNHLSMLIKAVPLENVGEELVDEVDDFVLKLLFCGVAVYMEKGLSPKYLDKIEELASQNYLAYIITDQSLCYGTNFPISNVILCDDLAEKLNMNEMFQLIGRAGRVGQSWTARAFIQEEGLKKLNSYIHDNIKMSQQAQIFEELAQMHLDSPQLTLRTKKSQIKYLNHEKPDNRIEIIVKKKKVEDYHIFRRVALVPYINSDKIMVRKMPYETFSQFEFPHSDILYEDLPTILNSEGSPIIDVESYYKNEQDFIKRTLNRACKRIIESVLCGKIDIKGQRNEFKAKVYEPYFSMKNNTFVILIKCEEEATAGDYTFQKIRSNDMDKLDEVLSSKIVRFVEECSRLAPRIRQFPSEILSNDVKEIKKVHKELMEREKSGFYKDIFCYYKERSEEEYNQITSFISDKSSLECSHESIIALTVDENIDLANFEHKLFHINWAVRDQWPKITGELDK